jgi:3-oxoacyl-[acyl-carrier protein] reductase
MAVDKQKTALLFPGQGSQFPGMALDLWEKFDDVKKLFALADDVFGMDVKKTLSDSTVDELKTTRLTQKMLALAELSALTALGGLGFVPIAAAGHSLGEYPALTAAGVLDARSCLKIVNARAEAMTKVVDGAVSGAGFGMAAVLGLDGKSVVEVIEAQHESGNPDIFAANFNSPAQTVVSGTKDGLGLAEAAFLAAGARRVVPLAVGGAFHSPFMRDAADEFRDSLETMLKAGEITLNEPRIHFFSNVTGQELTESEKILSLMPQQITSGVLWTRIEERIAALEPSCVLELGPGRVLHGLWRDSGSGVKCFGAGNVEDIAKLGFVSGDKMRLSDKKALVTGATRGIGRAIASRFLAEGAEVWGVGTKAPADLAERQAAAGGRLHFSAFDLAETAEIEGFIEGLVREAGRFDIVVNNAGITRDGLSLRMPLDDFRKVLDINLTAAFIVARTAARAMIQNRSGSIINMASVVGIHGNGGQVNYAASKAGLIAVTKTLAAEVAVRGVRVNAIAPGFMATDMTDAMAEAAKEKTLAAIPLKRMGTAEDVAACALFLASDEASYITGQVLPVDGGMFM